METLTKRGDRLAELAPGPHSLGQSVEWKLSRSLLHLWLLLDEGPTRWGNQLNGNFSDKIIEDSAKLLSLRPHSLGQSVEWKR